MGEVYLSEDTQLGRKVAVKILNSELAADSMARKRLVREARAAATLDHPNICSIHEVGVADGHQFIVMQFVEGETLDTRLKSRSIDIKEALNIAVQLADALVEAHTRGIIHRDIKPANVMLTKRGEVKMMDFGLAKILTDAVSAGSEAETAALVSTPGTVIGTMPYMSPEQVRAKTVDERSDIFSFGILLYEMITGHRPFHGASTAELASSILTHEPPPMARYSHEVPAELDRIVSKALHKDPDDRYQTSKDLLIDLRTLRDDVEFRHRLERSSPPEIKPVRTHTAEIPAEELKTRTFDDPPTTIGDAKSPPTAETVSTGKFPGRWIAVAAAVILIAGFAGWWLWSKSNQDWARSQLPKIEELAAAGNYFDAYDLAAEAEKYIPGDAVITKLMPTIADSLSVATEPPGADVYLTRFAKNADGSFEAPKKIGQTPITDQRIARGAYILSVQREGFAKVERTVSGAVVRGSALTIVPPPIMLELKLEPAGAFPEEMVPVPGGEYRMVAWQRPTDEKAQLDDFYIDRHEVSNREYKEFIAAGGYLRREFWKYPFSKDGKALTWEQAMDQFKGPTGLPQPRGWTNQNFPDGKADFPVTGISWYEAAAYAEFRGKQLPTVYQWEKAARDGKVHAFGTYMPWGFFYPGDSLEERANFGGGPWTVNSAPFGMSPFGAFDMAGNVSEWTLNEGTDGFFATGGSWGDPVYTFAQYSAFPGFYSSDKRGFRCSLVKNPKGDQGGGRLETKEEIPDYAISNDADFKKWSEFYRDAGPPLDARIEETTETDDWRRETITFNGADGERVTAYLYLPKNFQGPHQVMHIVPAADVDGGLRSLTASIESRFTPILKSGRAIFGVLLKGYVGRRPENFAWPNRDTVEYREIIVNRIIDVRRGLNYLETRPDIDAKKIALFGPSAGARIGLILASLETRYVSVLLQGAGVTKRDLQTIAEANPINFAPHIRVPKLMSHGKYDEDTPVKTQGEPLFKLLRQPKRIAYYEGGHVPSLEFLLNTINSWFDETLGPVKR
jgi:eukaryotic-like serine/threonine-protein kinase